MSERKWETISYPKHSKEEVTDAQHTTTLLTRKMTIVYTRAHGNEERGELRYDDNPLYSSYVHMLSFQISKGSCERASSPLR